MRISTKEMRALAQFRYQIRCFLHFSENAARAAKVEPQQYVMMLIVHAFSADRPPTIGGIADQLMVKHHSAVELVDRSVERGLVRRIRGEEDRRRVSVELTPKGERLISGLAAHHRDQLSKFAPALVEALTTLMNASR